MRIARRHGVKECFVSDLTWHVLDPFGKKMLGHEQVDNLILEGYQYYVKINVDKEINIGVGRYADLDQFQGYKLFSVAALVALDADIKGSTALYLLMNPDVDDGSGFAVALVDGNVYFDISFEFVEINSLIKKYQDICLKLGRECKILGDTGQLQGQDLSPVTLNDLLNKKKAKRVRVKPFKSERLQKIALLVISFITTGSLIYWGYGLYQDNLKKQQSRLLEISNLPSARYVRELPVFLGKKRLMISAVGQELFTQVGAWPVNLSGWSLSKLTCTPDACRATWKSMGGNYTHFLKSVPKTWRDFEPGTRGSPLSDLKSFDCTIPINLSHSQIPPLSQLPEAEKFKYDIGVLWQSELNKGLKPSLGDAEVQGLPPGVNAADVSGEKNVLKGMPWSMGNMDWTVAKQIMKKYPQNMELSSFELIIDVNGKSINFSGRGVAYVK